ncbi:MAG: GNAT family N-acetyltransferase [Pseudolabrys sp.]|jgi:GNAT superfamily N-acetyltransferase
MTAVMEASDRDLPPGLTTRPVGEDDLDAAQALSQEAGWNQTADDWRIFLELGRVIAIARGNDRLIATAAMLPYRPDFAWISMVLVTAAERRQGLARWLLSRCIEELLGQKLVPLLDATPAGRAVYVGLGFQDCWRMRRLIAKTVGAPNAPESAAVTIRAVDKRDWQPIIAFDKAVFGADRSALLQRLARRLPAAALVAEQHGRIVGYLFGRDGRNMNQLGPLAGADERIAIALLTQAITNVPPPLAVDLPDRHASLSDWLSALGFAAERPLTRMAFGRSQPFDDSAHLFAVAGPELG